MLFPRRPADKNVQRVIRSEKNCFVRLWRSYLHNNTCYLRLKNTLKSMHGARLTTVKDISSASDYCFAKTTICTANLSFVDSFAGYISISRCCFCCVVPEYCDAMFPILRDGCGVMNLCQKLARSELFAEGNKFYQRVVHSITRLMIHRLYIAACVLLQTMNAHYAMIL